jgi:predicted RNase H-like nuclease (RuvC/YqgF family)
VEKFIQQYQHLPDVPSAPDVQKNGLDLGDNQSLLLKKIEELTLYLIEQDKKLEQLQQEINELKKRKN